jgi:hypothetical protein
LRECSEEVLERVQRRAIGMVSGLQRINYKERLKELDMQTLEEQRHQTDMLQYCKDTITLKRISGLRWLLMRPKDKAGNWSVQSDQTKG